MKTKELTNIKNTNPTHVTRGGEFNVTSKLRLQDSLKWDYKGEKRVNLIQYLINLYPIELWDMIHQKNSKVSLVRTAYAQLKIKVAIKDPSLIEEVKKKHEKRKAVRQLKREIANGFINAKNSRFKKISSVKVIK